MKYCKKRRKIKYSFKKYNLGIIVNKNTLTGGTKEEFIQFIFEKCSNIKRKRKIKKTIFKQRKKISRNA